jgi:membrane protein implicated in regulation of membrane protease activity
MPDRTSMTGGGPAGFQVSTGPLVVGAVLVGAGAVLALAGFAIGGMTLITATRRRVQEMEQPPAEVLRQSWEKTKAATAAGVSAWNDGAPARH